MIALFGLDGASARALQKHYYRVYGTTLAGLIHEYDVRRTNSCTSSMTSTAPRSIPIRL